MPLEGPILAEPSGRHVLEFELGRIWVEVTDYGTGARQSLDVQLSNERFQRIGKDPNIVFRQRYPLVRML